MTLKQRDCLTYDNCKHIGLIGFVISVYHAMRSCYHMPLTNQGATTNVIQLALVRNSQRHLPRPGMLGCILTTNNSTCKVAFAAT